MNDKAFTVDFQDKVLQNNSVWVQERVRSRRQSLQVTSTASVLYLQQHKRTL